MKGKAITIKEWIEGGNVKAALVDGEGSRFENPKNGLEYEVRSQGLLGITAVLRSGEYAHRGPITKDTGFTPFPSWREVIPL